jgi:ABC-type cobalamin/Fe3+-siderophores transport system ATPase subunit
MWPGLKLGDASQWAWVRRAAREAGQVSEPRAFEFERVTIVRAGRRVLDQITARIPAAGITVVSGPSGAGKTTLLRLCNRLEVPDEGIVSYRGQPLDELDPLMLRRRVGMVFQRPTAITTAVIALGLIRRLFTHDHRLMYLPTPADH